MRRQLATLLLVLLASVPLFAQSNAPFGSANFGRDIAPSAPFQQPNWGTASIIWHTIPAYEFQAPLGGTVTFAGWATISLLGGTWVLAPVQLPSGAQVLGVVYQVCDDSTIAGLGGSLLSEGATGAGTYYGTYTIGDGPSTPGCFYHTDAYPSAVIIDNVTNTYSMEVNLGNDGTNTRLTSVRIAYLLAVSPAPGVATFLDVPTTHPLFQFVEALAASGITAGCDANNFCPNAPLTRGQMAVFLAKALGLHWPQ